jgi:HK97 family phage major capsid protein
MESIMIRMPELLEKRGSLVDEMAGLVAKDFAGTLGDDERSRFETLDGEVRALDAKLDRARRIDELERRAGADHATGEFDRELRSFSVAKAISESMAGRLSGREAEIHTELSKGRESRGVMIPTELLLGVETRGQTVGSDPAGGYTVATQLAGVADRFRPALKVEAMAQPFGAI